MEQALGKLLEIQKRTDKIHVKQFLGKTMLIDCVKKLKKGKKTQKTLARGIIKLIPVTKIRGQSLKAMTQEVGGDNVGLKELLDEDDMKFIMTSAEKVGGKSASTFIRIVELAASAPLLYVAWSKLLGFAIGENKTPETKDVCQKENEYLQKEIYTAAHTFSKLGDAFTRGFDFKFDFKNHKILTSNTIEEREAQSLERINFYNSIDTTFKEELKKLKETKCACGEGKIPENKDQLMLEIETAAKTIFKMSKRLELNVNLIEDDFQHGSSKRVEFYKTLLNEKLNQTQTDTNTDMDVDVGNDEILNQI